MKLLLEVYLVSYVGEGFHVVRKELDITQERQDPDSIVGDYLKYLFSDSRKVATEEKYILHSTSWHYDAPQSIVLTYLVYSDAFSFKHLSPWLLFIEDVHLAHSYNPKVPRPESLSSKEVVSHGLRHIAYLVQHDASNLYSSQISSEARDVFQALEPELAGKV